MTDTTEHLQERLMDLIDGRMSPAERAAAEAHLAECPRCRRESAAMGYSQAALSRLAREHDQPAPVRPDAAVAELPLRSRPATMGRPQHRPLRWLAAAALLFGLALWLPNLREPVSSDWPQRVARDYAALDSGAMTLALQPASALQMEQSFVAAGIEFPMRVFDLGMMGWQIEGGQVLSPGGQASALVVYRNPDGQALLCEMFVGSLAQLPPAWQQHEHLGIRFQVYRIGELTAVFWPESEGGVLCVLISSMDPQALIELAFAKATQHL